jgi:hypothetical protein
MLSTPEGDVTPEGALFKRRNKNDDAMRGKMDVDSGEIKFE